jgi:excisionase family DNA binding protein
MGQAQAALGISKPTLQRMVRAGRLAAYEDPRNQRVRLVRAEDIERLSQPQPAIILGAVYRNAQASFETRIVENRDEDGAYSEPRYLVQVRGDAASPWVTADGGNAPTIASMRAIPFLKRSTRPPELGG